jgi:hypothetical protein
LLEVRGLGIRRLAFEPVAVVGLVVELGDAGAERLPDTETMQTTIAGVRLPRLAVAPGLDPLPTVLAALRTPGMTPGTADSNLSRTSACPEIAEK